MIFAVFCSILATPEVGWSRIVVDSSDGQFSRFVEKELSLMRDSKRGVVCQELVRRLDSATATTTIKPITKDEGTWHPNDRKGTRSHVVSMDTKVRGAARTTPTDATVYVHPSRIDPALSLFKLGTFAHLLATAMDLNMGTFSGDYKIQEKRAAFFRNGWKDSLGLEQVLVSDRVPTADYKEAKASGLLTPENAALFPILMESSEPASP